MKVEISDVKEGSRYVAEHVAECKDSTDASAFREVLRCGDVVTMGSIVARPFVLLPLLPLVSNVE